MKVKNKKIKFQVTLEFKCTAPEEFEEQKEFDLEDARVFKDYIIKKLRECEGEERHAAMLKKVTIKNIPLNPKPIKWSNKKGPQNF